MIRQFTVLLREPNATGSGRHAVLASLASVPAHFRVVADGPADAAYTLLEDPPAGVRVVVFDASLMGAVDPGASCYAGLDLLAADGSRCMFCRSVHAVIRGDQLRSHSCRGGEAPTARGLSRAACHIAKIDWRRSFRQRFSTRLQRIHGRRQRWTSVGVDDRQKSRPWHGMHCNSMLWGLIIALTSR